MQKSNIKPPILLKTILDFAFLLLVVWLIIATALSAAIVFLQFPMDLSINQYSINQHEISVFFIPVIFGIVSQILIGAAFIYIIYLLRKVVSSFIINQIFTHLQIKELKLIGYFIIFTTVADLALNFFLFHFIGNKTEITFQLLSYNSFWFTLVLGLFFILLSQSFSYAKKLQEENDLTV